MKVEHLFWSAFFVFMLFGVSTSMLNAQTTHLKSSTFASIGMGK
jgi:hypothetical protein